MELIWPFLFVGEHVVWLDVILAWVGLSAVGLLGLRWVLGRIKGRRVREQ